MSEQSGLRPAPWVTRDSAFFWEAAKGGELVGQRCADCGVLRAPPRPMCPHCNSVKSEVQTLSGRGSRSPYCGRLDRSVSDYTER